MAEARPLARHLGLKQDLSTPRATVYRGADIALWVGGVGKLNAAAATARALAEAGADRPASGAVTALNFGVCGCADPSVPTGALYRVHRVTDVGSGRDVYPEMLVRSDLPEAALATHEHPVTDPAAAGAHLVDMEASGFFAAATTFLPPERSACLKLVSDHLEGRRLAAAEVEDGVAGRAGEVIDFLGAVAAAAGNPGAGGREEGSPGTPLAPADTELIEDLHRQLRLTATQGHQLRRWATDYHLRRGGGLSVLHSFRRAQVASKVDRGRVLAEIKTLLMEP